MEGERWACAGPSNTNSLIALTSLPWRPLELPTGSLQCLKSLVLLVSVKLSSISLPCCSSPERNLPCLIDSVQHHFYLRVHVSQSFLNTCRCVQGAVIELGPSRDLDALTTGAAGQSHWTQGPRQQGASFINIYLSFPVGFYEKEMEITDTDDRKHWIPYLIHISRMFPMHNIALRSKVYLKKWERTGRTEMPLRNLKYNIK